MPSPDDVDLIDGISDPEVIDGINEFDGYAQIQATWFYRQLMLRPETIVALYTGNRFGKNVNVAKHYMARIMGVHPIESKNMRPDTRCRILRVCSVVKPYQTEQNSEVGGEDQNTIYPVFKKMIPKSWVIRDVNSRNSTASYHDPQGGPPWHIEYVSYNQDVNTQAGVDRWSEWLDEDHPRDFFEEQKKRILTSMGDMVLTVTPYMRGLGWQHDVIFKEAGVIVRTDAVVAAWNKKFRAKVGNSEYTGTGRDIAVLMAATDDNPLFAEIAAKANANTLELIKSGLHPHIKDAAKFTPYTIASYLDEDDRTLSEEMRLARRYGIFTQSAGVIFKEYAESVHVIDGHEYFPRGVPDDRHIAADGVPCDPYIHARGIDYHPHNPWECGFAALSPHNEMFIYDELVADPEANDTKTIAENIARRSGGYRYRLSLIDPLAHTMQVNTGTTTVDDLNRLFPELKRREIGTGGFWTVWDTKSNRGREAVRERLANARICGKPFNNKQVRDGRMVYLPTIWVFSSCVRARECLKKWELEEWFDTGKLETRERKETPKQKYSHMNMVWECILKEQGFRPAALENLREERHSSRQYGRR